MSQPAQTPALTDIRGHVPIDTTAPTPTLATVDLPGGDGPVPNSSGWVANAWLTPQNTSRSVEGPGI